MIDLFLFNGVRVWLPKRRGYGRLQSLALEVIGRFFFFYVRVLLLSPFSALGEDLISHLGFHFPLLYRCCCCCFFHALAFLLDTGDEGGARLEIRKCEISRGKIAVW